MPVRIKICCIASRAEARLAVQHGAAALGLVSEMPSGPGVIAEDAIADIASGVPPGVATFLLTSRRDAQGIVAQQRRCGTNTLQLCDRPAPGVHAALRAELPGIGLVQVVHVTGAAALDEALAAASHVHGLLLDSGNPALRVKELGGTGRTHDWTVSRRIVEQAGVAVWLAGGLRADNVGDAIRAVRPFGVDVCSGVRTGGGLDAAKLAAFVAAVQRAAAEQPAG
jgi:phosphoribosylanthranilate isomerase